MIIRSISMLNFRWSWKSTKNDQKSEKIVETVKKISSGLQLKEFDTANELKAKSSDKSQLQFSLLRSRIRKINGGRNNE